MTNDIDDLMQAIAALNPVPAGSAPELARSAPAREVRARIMAIRPVERMPSGAARRRAPIVFALVALLTVAAIVQATYGYSSALSAVGDTLGLDSAPASSEVTPSPPAANSSTPATPGSSVADAPPAVRRLVALMGDRPGGIPEDQLPGAPVAGSVRQALGDLGALHRSIWLSTTDKGAVCEVIVTGDQGGGGCTAHFETGLPITTTTVGSDPAHDSGDTGPAYLFGLATSHVTGIDVVTADGTTTPASLANSAWYWETGPGPDALDDITLLLHTSDGQVRSVPLDVAMDQRRPTTPYQLP
jgi:hypothetical protein